MLTWKRQREWRTTWSKALKCLVLSCCSLRKTILSCSCFPMPQHPSKPFYSGDAGKRLHAVSLRTGLARILQTLIKWRNHWINWHYLDSFLFYFKLYFLMIHSYHEKDKYNRKTNPNGRNHYALEGLIFKRGTKLTKILRRDLRMERKHWE